MAGEQEGTALDELLLQSSHYAFACLALSSNDRESILLHPLNLLFERRIILSVQEFQEFEETICNYDKRMIESNAIEILEFRSVLIAPFLPKLDSIEQ